MRQRQKTPKPRAIITDVRDPSPQASDGEDERSADRHAARAKRRAEKEERRQQRAASLASGPARERRGKLRSPLDDLDFATLATEVIEQRRSLLGADRLHTLYQALQNVVASAAEAERIHLVEVGVYRGGSACFLARAARELAPGRVRMVAVDTFEGHSALDLPDGPEGPHHPSAFADTSYEDVAAYLSELDFVELIKGRIQDVGAPLLDRPVHLAHVDVDIYAPTAYALQLVDDRRVEGTTIVVDDYGFVTCPGVKKAVDEFVAARAGRFFKLALGTGQCCLVAMRGAAHADVNP
jgi:O-methyltransferase